MSKFSVRKPLTVFVAVLAVIILGVVAFTRMTPDLLPNMDFPYVIIMTTYPGQSPEVIEQEITRPLEQSMSTLDHIQQVTSTSNENYSLVVLEFEQSVNMDTIGVDIQQSISALQGGWDETVGSPYVLKINPSVIPIAIASVSKSDMDITELSDFLDETIIPKLEGVNGVASVSTSGSIYRQVNVVISQDKIDAVNARMADAVNGRLDDAKTELEDTKTELEDAKAELDSAKEELDSGKETLVTQSGSAQATLSEKQLELINGKLEIQDGIAQLQSAQSQVAAGLQMLQPIADSYVQAEESRDAADAQLAQLDALEAAQSKWQALQDEQTALPLANADLELQIIEVQGKIDPLAAKEAADELTEDDKTTLEQLRGQLADLEGQKSANDTRLAQLPGLIEEAKAAVDAAQEPFGDEVPDRTVLSLQRETAQGVIDGLDLLLESGNIEGVTDQESLEAQIDTLTATQGELAGQITQLQGTLAQLDSGAIQLSQAMGVLSQSQSAGLLQLADAATQITLNSSTIESALSEVDSGLEQLETSRTDALKQADLSGSITMSTVAQILGAQNFSMPAGYIQEDGVSYMVSVGDELTEEDELKQLLLFDTGEDGIGPIYLQDVADIFITDNADSVYAKLNGSDSVMLTFDKQSNAATAEVSDALQARFDELEQQYPGLEFVLLMDQGDYIYLIVNSILESLFTGAIFAIIVLFLFLRDLRPTLITLVSIPVSVVFAFVLMYFSGVTLNMISLSGLAVAVGMLVDNSIVVIENIYRLRSKGATAVQAAVAGSRQVAGAITSSTLTTVCVFLPIVFVEGITKQLFTDLALTMTFALMASLVIALTLVPAMAKGMLRDRKRHKHDRAGRHAGREKRESVIYRGYRALAGWNLRHKWVVLTASVALLGASAWLCLGRGFSFMPEIDMNTVNVTITMPEDADRDQAVALADQALERIAELPNAQYVGAMMGSASLAGAGGGMSLSGGASSGGQYDVTVYVGLPEGDSGAEAGAWIAERCADLDCEVEYDSAMMDMSLLTGSGITVNVYSEDMQTMQQAAGLVANALSHVEGVAEVDDGLEDAQTAYHVSVDRNAAMKKGFTVAQIYMDLATALTDSTTAMDMTMGSVSADVVVQNDGGMSLDALRAYTFESTDQMTGETTSFRLDDVAKVEPTVSMNSIHRADQRRYMAVTASLEPGYNVTRVTAAAQAEVAATWLPDDATVEFAGENETIMEAVEDLMLMLAIGVVLVYFIMVAQFQSLKSPFIVMFTIPLAFTGGFAALLICGMDVSIVSIIGFVMLVGIIVNNGIVLVDYVNQLRAGGMDRREALIEAGVTRMRPIFMTSLTTILGLIVMAIGQNVGTSLMQPVAVVCIGGLLYATIMTLFVVPCIYDMMNRKAVEVITEADMTFDDDGIA